MTAILEESVCGNNIFDEDGACNGMRGWLLATFFVLLVGFFFLANSGFFVCVMGCNTSSFFAVLDIFCFFTGFAILTDGFSFLDDGGSFVSFFVFELAVSLFDVFFFVADSVASSSL